MARAKRGSGELLKDYALLESMSRELALHRKKMFKVGKRLVKKANQSDISAGLIDNLDIVLAHMSKAEKEIEEAKKRLKKI